MEWTFSYRVPATRPCLPIYDMEIEACLQTSMLPYEGLMYWYSYHYFYSVVYKQKGKNKTEYYCLFICGYWKLFLRTENVLPFWAMKTILMNQSEKSSFTSPLSEIGKREVPYSSDVVRKSSLQMTWSTSPFGPEIPASWFHAFSHVYDNHLVENVWNISNLKLTMRSNIEVKKLSSSIWKVYSNSELEEEAIKKAKNIPQ